tara:strand:- start:119 stop:1123 length:1005 start_codon:yes stop_codon:yes gene_type:complete
MYKVLVTTVPFSETNQLPLELLNSKDIKLTINPLNRKLTDQELSNMVSEFDILIAGTEPINKLVLSEAKNLKLISRVGIGLDSVDLNEAKKRGIHVTYTPDAPAPAVAELTFGLMLSLLRSIQEVNIIMKEGNWKRIFGRRLSEVTIGVIGAGRIGGRVLRRLAPFGTPRILVNDIDTSLINKNIAPSLKLEWVDKKTIYESSDLITIHVPKTSLTDSMINKKELMLMKKDALLINTSRGGIINENDLLDVLKEGHLGGVALDVFDQEPYKGPLSNFNRCILTSHMGSMSFDCRQRMEIEAVDEVIRFIKNEPFNRPVPKDEYIIQMKNKEKQN